MSASRTHGGAAGAGPRGMTLVELLVVTGLIAVFLGLVVVGVRGGRQAQKRGAETLAAVLSAAQARALGVPEGAAAILGSGSGSEPAAAAACTSLYDAVMLPLIDADCTLTQPSPLSSGSATVSVSARNGEDVSRAYKILLDVRSDARTAPPSAWLAFQQPSTVCFRDQSGQTAANTVWPKAVVGVPSNAVLAQYPAKSSAVVEIDDSIAVDLRFSGVGDDRARSYGRLDVNPPPDNSAMGSIAIVFDRVGRVAEVIQKVPEPGASVTGTAPQPCSPTGTIYFLVAPRDLIASGTGNTLASDNATWVALDPQTGRIFVADNVVQTGTDINALRAARAKVRQGIGVGK